MTIGRQLFSQLLCVHAETTPLCPLSMVAFTCVKLALSVCVRVCVTGNTGRSLETSPRTYQASVALMLMTHSTSLEGVTPLDTATKWVNHGKSGPCSICWFQNPWAMSANSHHSADKLEQLIVESCTFLMNSKICFQGNIWMHSMFLLKQFVLQIIQSSCQTPIQNNQMVWSLQLYIFHNIANIFHCLYGN